MPPTPGAPAGANRDRPHSSPARLSQHWNAIKDAHDGPHSPTKKPFSSRLFETFLRSGAIERTNTTSESGSESRGHTSSVRTTTESRLVGALIVVLAGCSGELDGTSGQGPGGMPSGEGSVSTPSDGPGGPSGTPGVAGDPSAPGATGDPASPGGPLDPATPGTTPGTPGSSTPETPATVDPDIVEAISNAEPLPLSLESGEPLFARTVRLTHAQWERSVAWLLRLSGETGERSGLTDDASATNDFSNNEDVLYVTGTLWADYANAAQALAAEVSRDDAALAAIYPGTDAPGFISTFGRRAFRRPLTDTELADYQALFDTGASLSEGGASEFARGAGLVIEGMLQSPNFLYRVELTPAGERLSGYELAAKLSLLLRGVTPDDALLDAAEQGQLNDDAAVANLASQMVDEPGFLEVMRGYHGELLSFNRYLTIEKDQSSVPEYTSELNQELQEAAYLFFDRIVGESLGLREVLTTDVGFVGPRMAQFYEVQAPGNGFSEITLPPERPGFFTQLPFLILNSVNLVPDSIHRGVSLNLDVLCAEVPPPLVVVPLPGESEGGTNRERIDALTGDGTCGSTCHGGYINPLGFAFENFDGLGRVREMDNGAPVDTSGTYPFVEGDLSFANAPELMQRIADGQQAHDCYAKHLAGFALQRDLDPNDQGLIDQLSTASRAPGSSVKQLVLALVSDPAFTTRATGGTQ